MILALESTQSDSLQTLLDFPKARSANLTFAWGNGVRLSDREPLFVCKTCGHRRADVRSLFEPTPMGTGG